MGKYKKSELTKDAILTAAKELFLEKGYYSTTVRDICKSSGVSLSRLNYHFSSKADLAADICRDLFRNFYSELKNTIKNDRGYSLVVEAITLRFLVDLVVDIDNKYEASVFYRDLSKEGIFGSIFTPNDQGEFSKYMTLAHFDNIKSLSDKIVFYSHIFGNSFSAVINGWDDLLEQHGGDKKAALKVIQDIYAGLFMQMMDMPHDAQRAMVEISHAYYSMLKVELSGLTNVSISMPTMPSLRDKVGILESIIDNEKIRLKSTPDRKNIELDTDI